MANDERQSETFIREVDEELRRDQLKALWKRFAPLIIGVCVLVVALTAGYRGWIWWHERQAARAGDRFMAAVEQIAGGNRAAGEAELQAIASESGAGYAALARLRLAGEKAAAGEKADALAAFDALSKDSTVAPGLRDLARVRAALLALDAGDVEGAKTRAAPLDSSGNPWRHAAREVLGTAAYQVGDLNGARDIFSKIQEDAQTPPDLWMRSGLMINLIEGQLGDAAATKSSTADAPPVAADAAPAPDGSPAPAPALNP